MSWKIAGVSWIASAVLLGLMLIKDGVITDLNIEIGSLTFKLGNSQAQVKAVKELLDKEHELLMSGKVISAKVRKERDRAKKIIERAYFGSSRVNPQ